VKGVETTGQARRHWAGTQTLWQVEALTGGRACLAAIVQLRPGVPTALAQESADKLLRVVCDSVPFLPKIEAKELPILRAYMVGQDPAEIAAATAYDEKAVRSCLRSVRGRLALPSGADLRQALWAVYARRRKLFFADEVVKYALLASIAVMAWFSAAPQALAEPQESTACSRESATPEENRSLARGGHSSTPLDRLSPADPVASFSASVSGAAQRP